MCTGFLPRRSLCLYRRRLKATLPNIKKHIPFFAPLLSKGKSTTLKTKKYNKKENEEGPAAKIIRSKGEIMNLYT